MKFEIDPEVGEFTDSIWATPFGQGAKVFMLVGLIILVIMLISRYKMTFVDAILAVIGFKSIPGRDLLFNLIWGFFVVGTLLLLLLSFIASHPAYV